MPVSLDIDYKANLNGAMAAYNRHLLVSTSKSDWKSKVEEEDSLPGRLIRDLKAQYGRGGRFYDVSRGPDPRRIRPDLHSSQAIQKYHHNDLFFRATGSKP